MKIDLSTPCIEYKGYHNKLGYATSGGHPVHRKKYAEAGGILIKGMHLDHLCRNRGCINPLHLEQVTPRENIMRGKGIAVTNAAKTHCPSGHPYNKENTRQTSKGRWCRTCDLISTKKYEARKRLERKSK